MASIQLTEKERQLLLKRLSGIDDLSKPEITMISRLNKRVHTEFHPGIRQLAEDLDLLSQYYSTLDVERKEQFIADRLKNERAIKPGHLANAVLNWTDPSFQCYLIDEIFEKKDPKFVCSSFLNYMVRHDFINFTNDSEIGSLNNDWINIANKVADFKKKIDNYPSFKETKNHYFQTHYYFNAELLEKYSFIHDKKSWGRLGFDSSIIEPDLLKVDSPVSARIIISINWPLAIIASMIYIERILDDKSTKKGYVIEASNGSTYRIILDSKVDFEKIQSFIEEIIQYISEGVKWEIEGLSLNWCKIKPEKKSVRIIKDRSVGRPMVKLDFSTQLIKQLNETITLLVKRKIIRRSRGRKPTYYLSIEDFNNLFKIGYFFTKPEYWKEPLSRIFYPNIFSVKIIDILSVSEGKKISFMLDEDKFEKQCPPYKPDDQSIDDKEIDMLSAKLHNVFLREIGEE